LPFWPALPLPPDPGALDAPGAPDADGAPDGATDEPVEADGSGLAAFAIATPPIDRRPIARSAEATVRPAGDILDRGTGTAGGVDCSSGYIESPFRLARWRWTSRALIA
jgi:hypothetical protein